MRKLSWTATFLIAALFPLALLAFSAADGKATFLGARCQTCHSVKAAGIEALAKSERMKGPDLTNLHSRLKAEFIAKYLRKEEQLEGKAHRTEFKGSDEELQALVDWLLEQKSE